MSNSIANPSRVYITSQDRDPDEQPANFTVTLPSTIENAKSFQIVSFAVPNIFYQFGENQSVLYFTLYNSGTNTWVFYAMNLGIEPLLDSELPRVPASAYAGGNIYGGASSPTRSGYYRIFPTGLVDLQPTLAPASQTRLAIVRRNFVNGVDLAAYLQALLRSVLAAEVVDETGVADANAWTYLTGGASPNALWTIAYDGFAPAPTTNGTFRLSFRTAGASGFTQVGLLGITDSAKQERPFYINYRLGFTDEQDASPVASFLYEYGQSQIDLLRTQDIYVASSLTAAESIASSGRRDILFKLPITGNYGDILSYQSTLDETGLNRLPNLIRTISITLLDDLFEELVLPSNAITSLELHFKFMNTPYSQAAVSLR